MKRMSETFIFALFIFLLSSLAGAQNTSQTSSQPSSQTADQSSLGDYARRVRKDTVKPKPKVFDNDNLPTDDKLSVIGQKPATEASAAPAAEDKDKQAANADDEQAKKQAAWKGWQDKLTGQKDKIDLAARELDVLQREYQLRAAVMYADAGNRLRNETAWDKEDREYKQKIADKQKEVDDAKQKLSDLQEEARKAGVPSSMIE